MLSNNRVLSTILLLLFVYLSFFCEIFANNYDESKYVLENNQLRNISTDAVVEGSVASGGLQPNYIIDWNNNAFDEIRKFSQKTKQSSKPYLEKLNEIQNFIKSLLENHYKNYNGLCGDVKFITSYFNYKKEMDEIKRLFEEE